MASFKTTYREYSVIKKESTSQGMNHVAVLFGGMSSEREVSLISGNAIIKSLVNLGYTVTSVDVGADIGYVIKQIDPDVVFNALHGTYGEDGCIPGVLNIMRVPYTHSGVLASSVAFDKIISRNIFAANNIKCADAIVIDKSQNIKSDPMQAPYVIKPLREGSSIGVHVVFPEDNFRFSDYKFEYGDKILIEKYIKGREMQVAVLDGKALGVLEIKLLKHRFYDYETKYTEGLAEHILPANLSAENYKKVMYLAEQAYGAIGCRGIARVEFIYSDAEDQFYILEINTHPGFTPLSICPEIAAYNGLNFDMFVEKLLEGARID